MLEIFFGKVQNPGKNILSCGAWMGFQGFVQLHETVGKLLCELIYVGHFSWVGVVLIQGIKDISKIL